MSDAACSALVLGTIGRAAAATKYSIFLGLGNVPDLYMTALSGWVHDRWSTPAMLATESVGSLLCIGLAVLALLKLPGLAPRRPPGLRQTA